AIVRQFFNKRRGRLLLTLLLRLLSLLLPCRFAGVEKTGRGLLLLLPLLLFFISGSRRATFTTFARHIHKTAQN
ncbi:hypothetical protein XC71_21295, partial [Klebsiella pneumoniae]|nr:hypothetical protein [Klebsiella pneumoniae]MDS1352204.1 hypothetical protein [Klebsiella pneumoniae]